MNLIVVSTNLNFTESASVGPEKTSNPVGVLCGHISLTPDPVDITPINFFFYNGKETLVNFLLM